MTEKEELELKKMEAEIMKIMAETRKLMAEAKVSEKTERKILIEYYFYPFVAMSAFIAALVGVMKYFGT